MLGDGAVVDGTDVTFHTPLSGQRSPVRAVVPMGLRERVSGITPPIDAD